jgi:thiazole synthase
MSGPLKIAGREFSSRLLIGTGKFSSNEIMRDALAASGAEIVTVALRRADLSGKHDPFANILDFIDPSKYLLLPNTSGALDASEAVRLARLAAAAGLPRWVKLEIHPDPHYLLPDPIETLKAAEILGKEALSVSIYQRGSSARQTASRCRNGDSHATRIPVGSNRGSKPVPRSKSSSSKLPFPSWSMRASARRVTPPRLLKWEPMPCL